MAGRSPNIYVCVGDIELRIYIAEDRLIGLNDSLEIDINEEIVGIDVLFDETFHLQKCRKKVPFILDMVRPVVAAQSISYIESNTTFENAELIFTQPKIQLRCWLRARNHLLETSFCIHSLLAAGKECISRYEMKRLDRRRRARRNETAYLCCIDGICQRFALVERLEESIEALAPFNNSLTKFGVGMNAYIILTILRWRLRAQRTCSIFACRSFFFLRCYYFDFLCWWV